MCTTVDCMAQSFTPHLSPGPTHRIVDDFEHVAWTDESRIDRTVSVGWTESLKRMGKNLMNPRNLHAKRGLFKRTKHLWWYEMNAYGVK